MSGRGIARRTRDWEPGPIPCGGKGWRDGECEFCRTKGAEYRPLRNVPRDEPEVVTFGDALRGRRCRRR